MFLARAAIFAAPVLAGGGPWDRGGRGGDPGWQRCGDQWFDPRTHLCDNSSHDGGVICPRPGGGAGWNGGGRPPWATWATSATAATASTTDTSTSATSTSSTSTVTAVCTENPTTQHLSDTPYENYFYSDCHAATQVVVTSPVEGSNLTIIGPRLLVAWPAGNSGSVVFFEPENGINGTLSMALVNGTADQPLQPVYTPANDASEYPTVGISTLVELNSSAVLTVAILGSIRTIRDFTEGPSLLHPIIQNATHFSPQESGGAAITRLWLDNVTTTTLTFASIGGESITLESQTLKFPAGTYNFTATFDYPQLTQLSAEEVLNEQSQDVIQQNPDQTTSLSFLSYSEKLLAGAWRFLTYFGRDSMISLLLLQPILSEGQGGAIEAVIGAVLERLNPTTGIVCHEETIGDYATFVNLQNNITSTAPSCTYIMVDTTYYLAPVLENYFIKSPVGRARRDAFFNNTSTLDFGNRGMSYGSLALKNAEKVMASARGFAQPGGQVEANLVHLEEGQIVGEWRDSTYGIGGARNPYDVNTALVPAALRAIASLSSAGFFPEHPDWATTAASYAQIWEDETLPFFEVRVSPSEATTLLTNYTTEVGDSFPSETTTLSNSADVVFHGLGLQGNDNQAIVRVMNTDDCFRHFLLNTTNQAALTAFVNQTANNILRPFPAGLSNPIGLLVANPAYGGAPVYAANWTASAYHGTVVWSWPMAMMAAGLARQLDRCSSTSPPDFCADAFTYDNVRAAYNHLWDLIERNTQQLSSEVWSFTYDATPGAGFQVVPLGALPPPPGQSPTESDIRQLWSLTFLSVKRDESLR